MGLSIKNAEVEEMARKLARKRGVSLTEAIRQSLKREIERESLIPREEKNDYVRRILEITQRTAAFPDINDMTDDEILGYDEFGAPTK